MFGLAGLGNQLLDVLGTKKDRIADPVVSDSSRLNQPIPPSSRPLPSQIAALRLGHGDETVFIIYRLGVRDGRVRRNAVKGNENGDVEQSHRQFKRALDQALMLRGSRDFVSREAYEAFLRQMFEQCNAGRRARLAEELPLLRALPARRLEACKRDKVRVDSSSTIRVEGNVYSVNSRLIGEWVEARLYAERVEVWYAQKQVEQLPRLRGRGKHKIAYRHVIDWLVRKPGAFADYRYRADLFPSSRFRLAYDVLLMQQPERAAKEYLSILQLAARESESGVEAALKSADERGVDATDGVGGAGGVAEKRWALVVAGSDGGARGPGVV